MKAHLNAFLVWMRRLVPGIKYLWFLEFQRRGAPHFHILLSIEAGDALARSRVALQWLSIQGLGDWPYSRLSDGRLFHVKQSAYDFASHEKTWENATSSDVGLARYAVKYSLKTRQKIVPDCYSDVGRFWGCSRSVGRPKSITIDCDESELRQYIAKNGRPDVAAWDVIPKYVILGR